jgi:hypothetical protein
MFKKFITVMMAVAIFTVSAHASTQSGLKAAFDELNYALTVEWDQKDQNFHKAQVKKFNESILELQSQGLTSAEFAQFIKSEVKNERIAKDLETALNMISLNRMSRDEASKYMMSVMEKAYANGASWNSRNGGALVGLGIILVLLGSLVLISDPNTSTSGRVCGYDYYYCGETCYGYPYSYCEENYCCY